MKNVTKFGLSTIAIALTAFMPGASALETVELNKTHLLRLPAPASAIIIGNPKIADVSVHSDSTLFLLGRGYGETDILILDAQGNTLLHTDIQVIAPKRANGINLITPGSGQKSYNCTPYCRPAPVIGDDPAFRKKYESGTPNNNNGTANLSPAPVSNMAGAATQSNRPMANTLSPMSESDARSH